jgi:hypothetical protein
MTKLLIKQSIAGHTFAHQPGDVVFIEKHLASAWVESGIAAYVIEPVPVKEFAVARKFEAPEKQKALKEV